MIGWCQCILHVIDPVYNKALFVQGHKYRYEHVYNTVQGEPFYYVYASSEVRMRLTVKKFNSAFMMLIGCEL
jgi:hypothetical protein